MTEKKEKRLRRNKDIAIIGMACRFPGANNYLKFWDNLLKGKNSIKEITPDRWDVTKYYSPDINEHNKSISKWCGLMDGIDRFDNNFFNISPREAKNMDPQQRLLLEETWHCIEDSGIPIKRLSEKITSVYIGFMANDYYIESSMAHSNIDSYSCVGSYNCILSNRISHFFNLRGNSMAIDAACASSLVALHEAKESLRSTQCDYSIVGGVSLNFHPWKYISFSKSRMLSPDGQCKTFDKDANGYVPGEGIGVLLLQRLEDAIKEGNHVYGLVKGSAVSHSGRTLSITAPRAEAQRDVILSTYQDAGIEPDTISYIEAHGTGTSLGDPIEIEALTQAFHRYSKKNQFCKIGSVKTNIGHLEAAAGVAGVIKVLLMMKYKKIVRTLNIKTLNPIINFEKTPFIIAQEPEEWIIKNNRNKKMPRRSGVSSFGFGGVNSHVLLEEYGEESTIPNKDYQSNSNNIFLLSAKSVNSLTQLLAKWRDFIDSGRHTAYTLKSICGTLMAGRSQLPCRCGTVVSSISDLTDSIVHNDFPITQITGKEIWCLKIGNILHDNPDHLISLFEHFDLFRIHYTHLLNSLRNKSQRLKRIIAKEINTDEKKSDQPVLTFIVLYSYLKTLMKLGFTPHFIMGEGNGMLLSLTMSGMVDVDDAVMVIYGAKKIENIKVRRPRIPFYDCVSNQVIMPFYFDRGYLRLLIDGLNKENKALIKPNISQSNMGKVLNYYIEKARLLSESQFTFKKYLQEWDNELNKYGKKLSELMHNDSILSTDNGYFDNEKLLLAVIILSSLRRVNTKWDLTEHFLVKERQFNELVDLVIDNVMTKEHVIELLLSQKPNYESLAQELNRRQGNINIQNPYIYLRRYNQTLFEIQNFPNWLKAAGKEHFPIEEENEKIYFEITSNSSPKRLSNVISVGSLKELKDNLHNILLQFWLKGATIKWEKLFLNNFKKSSLPGYCFESKSFWLPHTRGRERLLLDTDKQNTQTGMKDEVKSQREFSLLDPIIQDHIITNKNIIPAAAMLELALENIDQHTGRSAVILKNCMIQKPGIVTHSLTLKAVTDPFQQNFEIKNNGIVLCKGKYEKQTTDLSNFTLDISSLRSMAPLDMNNIYQLFSEAGYHYGKNLRVIQKIWHFDDKYIIELVEKNQSTSSATMIRPELLDGVFQAALIVGYIEGTLQIGDFLFVPYIINMLRLSGTLYRHCFVELNKVDTFKKDGSYFVNLKTYDAYGKPVLALDNMCFKKVSLHFLDEKIVPEPRREKEQIYYYTPLWIESVIGKADENNTQRAAIFLTNQDKVNQQLAKEIASSYPRKYFITCGEYYEAYKEGGFKINYDAESDYTTVLRAIFKDGGSTCNQYDMYYLFAYDSQQPLKKGENCITRQEEVLKSLFFLVKGLAVLQPSLAVSMIVPIADSQIILNGDKAANYAYGSIFGLAKTVMQENPRLKITVLDIEQNNQSLKEMAQILIAEATAVDFTDIVAYRNKRRYVRTYVKEELKAQQTMLKDEGVYLILGGTGGIGLKITRMLCQHSKATLILLGRKAFTHDREDMIRQLKRIGKSEIIYYQCDIQDAGQIKQIVENIRKQYHHLNGIIHSCGVLEDKLIVNKDWESFRRVITPKIKGAWLLHELTKTEPLDFFVVFSSIVSVTGNAGQIDYAAANSFLDALIHYRAHNNFSGRSISINWTLWADGGMGTKSSTVNAFIRKTGIIQGDSGVNAFKKILDSTTEQCLVVGDAAAFEKTQGIGKSRNDEIQPSQQEKPQEKDNRAGLVFSPDKANDDIAKDELQRELLKLLSEVIEVNVEELDLDTDIREYGMDSISISDFVEKIDDMFDILIDPTVFYSIPRLRDLVDYIFKEHNTNLIHTAFTEEHHADAPAAVQSEKL